MLGVLSFNPRGNSALKTISRVRTEDQGAKQRTQGPLLESDSRPEAMGMLPRSGKEWTPFAFTSAFQQVKNLLTT